MRDYVLGLVKPAEQRLQGLLQLARVQQSSVQTLISVGNLMEVKGGGVGKGAERGVRHEYGLL